MEDSTEKNPQSISWWITSLAISVTCCAVLFVIFAGYLGDIKKQLANENAEMEQMVLHQDKLLSEIQSLQRTVTSNEIPVAPGAIVVPATSTSAPAPATSVTGEPPVTAPTGTTAPTVTVPAAAAPTVIPEVPAKK